MASELWTMSARELERLGVIQRCCERRLTQPEAAQMLGVGVRQVQRMVAAFRARGPAGLVSARRGKPSNNRLPAALAQTVVDLVASHYRDFGPTLAWEKLTERHGLQVSVESVRKLMIGAGLWLPRAQRAKRVQQPRRRRPCFGELIQIDGCEHAWFEHRAPVCTALVFVDDATSCLQALRFAQGESTFEYFEALADYLAEHGKPVAFYSDKHSVFRVNRPKAINADMTQFARALTELNIDILCANTSAAKGRVERTHLTLQDRLVKELRLAGISSIEAANAFAPAFIADYNRRFGRAPQSTHNAHRPLLPTEDLHEILCWQEQRTVSQALTVQYDRVRYLIEPTAENRALARRRVTVFDYPDGTVRLKFEGRELRYREFDKVGEVRQADVVSNKRLGAALGFAQQQQALRPLGRCRSAPTRRLPSSASWQ